MTFAHCFAWQFVKDSGRYVEENKLKVALVSPPNSPVLSPINGTMNQGIDYDASIPIEPVLNRVGVLAPVQTVRSTLSTFLALKIKLLIVLTYIHVYTHICTYMCDCIYLLKGIYIF